MELVSEEINLTFTPLYFSKSYDSCSNGLKWVEGSLDMYPTQQKSAPSSTVIIPSLEMFLDSQGPVIQLIFKTGEGYWNKISCSEEHTTHGDMLSHYSSQSRHWQALLPQPFQLLCTHCTTPTSQLKPLLTPQGTRQFSIQQHTYHSQCNYHRRKQTTITKLVR